MSYIGNTSTTQAFTPAVDFFNGNGSTTAFTLSRPVASVAQVQAVISNVPQNPGTAYTVSGNTITFTSAPPSGTQNIYVYYTSPITQVIAPGQGTVAPTSLSQGGPSWDTSGNVTLTGNIRLNNGTADGAQVSLASSGYSDWNIDNYSGNFRWYYNATEYMRLDASGNLGVGTTSPSYRLQVETASATGNIVGYFRQGSGAVASILSTTDLVGFGNGATAGETRIYADGGSGFVTLRTNSTERARINSSGFFKASNTGSYIGSTGPYYEFTSNDASTGQTFIFYNTNASLTQSAMMFLGANRNTTNNTYYYFGCYNYTTSTYKLQIADSGNVTNTNNSYGAISDIKLKENITDATPKLEKLNQVRVVNYNFIGDNQKQLGVIAQELEQIFPGMVEESADTERVTTTDENGNEVSQDIPTGTFTKSVKYSVFVPMLIKAIQEQQAIIETLTNRITALENK